MKLNSKHIAYLFNFLFIIILLGHLLFFKNSNQLLLILKVLLIVVYFFLALKSKELAILNIIVLGIIFGFNGSFQKVIGPLPLVFFFFVILAFFIIINPQNRQFLLHQIKNSPIAIFLLVGISFVLFIGIFEAIINRNNIDFLINDIDGWIFYFLFFILIIFIRTREYFNKLFYSIIISIGLSALLIVSIYLSTRFNVISEASSDYFIYNILNLGGHSEKIYHKFYRIYAGNSIFLPLGISLGIALFFIDSIKRRFLWGFLIIIMLLSLLISFNRATWLASFLSMITIFIFIPITLKKKISIVFILLLFTSTLFYALFKETPWLFIKNQYVRLDYSLSHEYPKNEREKIHSEYPLGKTSLMIKIQQYRKLIKKGLRRPFFGYGFGATLPERETFRNKKDTTPYIFEASYGDLFMKTGFVGLLFWSIFPFIIIFQACKLLINQNIKNLSLLSFEKNNTNLTDNQETDAQKMLLKMNFLVIIAFLVSLLDTLFIFGTNPYLYSPFGILLLVLTAFAIDFIS